MLKQVSSEYYTSINPNPSFTVVRPDEDSAVSHLHTPYQLTYEYCSGTGPKDYMNVVTLSERGSFYARDSYNGHVHSFNEHPLHFHDHYEFMVVLEGDITQNIEGTNCRYTKGMACLINRGVCHAENFNSKSQLLFLGVSVDFLNKLINNARQSVFAEEKAFLDSKLYHFIADDLSHPDRKAYLDFNPIAGQMHIDKKMDELCLNLLHSLLMPHFGTTYAVSSYLSEILWLLSSDQYYECIEKVNDMEIDRRLFFRIQHLMELHHGCLSRQQLSELLNYSGDYIARIVHKHSGQSLYDYRMSFCMKHAAWLIENTNSSAAKIAEDLGFTNRTQFYKMFQKHYHMTPGEYKRQ